MEPFLLLRSFERLSAKEVEIFGKRAIQLTYKHEMDVYSNPPRPPRLVSLIVQQELSGYTGFPASFEYLEESVIPLPLQPKGIETRQFPIIQIIAAPGVSVLLQNWKGLGLQPTPEYPQVVIYRVQDPEMVPPIGMSTFPPSLTFSLTGSEAIIFTGNEAITLESIPPQTPVLDITWPEGPMEIGIASPDNPTLTSNPPPKKIKQIGSTPDIGHIPNYKNYLEVHRQPSEVIFYHPFSATALTISVPQCTQSPGDIRNAQARFCYEFNPQGSFSAYRSQEGKSVSQPLVRILKTPDVDLSISGSSRFKKEANFPFWEAWEVKDINAVPPQGFSLVPPQPGWNRVNAIPRPIPPPDELLAETAFDTAISLIPVVGNIYVIGQFIYAYNTGYSPWGHRIDRKKLVEQGAYALIAFAFLAPSIWSLGTKLGRLGTNLVQIFGRHSRSVLKATTAIKEASLTREEAELVRKLTELERPGRSPSSKDVQDFAALLHRLKLEYPSLESGLNAEGTGFINPELQAFYQQYKQRTKNPSAPDVWARKVTGGRPRVHLIAHFGPDFAKMGRVSSENFVNTRIVVRPKGYTDAELNADMNIVNRQPGKLTEWLDNFLKELNSTDPIVQSLARIEVSGGYFNILKGNLAEILSLKIQLKILSDLRSAYKEPKAFLITGVRIRLMSTEKKVYERTLSQELLFTDNIVAVQRGGSMKILGVIEVKAGYKGGQEATSQIFKWNENLITDGSQVVLPKGACYMDVNGAVKMIEKEQVFTYKGRRGTPAVLNLIAADRFIITARGKSFLGMKSAEQIIRPVPKKNRLQLERSSDELDYLAARIIAKWQSSPKGITPTIGVP